MSLRIPRRQYADLYGPTVGDRVRLADTDLVIEVERDFTTLWRRGEVRRGQGDPRRHGPVGAGHVGGGRARSRHHQCADPGSLGHRESRHRRQGRPHRRRGQGGESRHHGGRDGGDGRGGGDGGDRRRGTDRDSGRHRQPHPLHLPPARGRGADRGADDADRRWHGPRHRYECDDVLRRTLEHPPDARGRRRAADQPRISRQGQCRRGRHRSASRSRRAPSGSSCTRTGGRRRRRSTRRSRRRRDGRAGRDSHRHAERGGLSSRSRSRRSRGARSTPITRKARGAAMRPTSSASAAGPIACRRRPIRRCRSP